MKETIKKILSRHLLVAPLAMAVAIGFMPVMGLTVEATDNESPVLLKQSGSHKHTICGSGKDCTVPWHNSTSHGDEIEFTSWDGTTSLTADGKYFLTDFVELESTLVIPEGTVTICLNGYGIRRKSNAASEFSVISIFQGSTLNMCDCGTTSHKFDVGSNGLWTLNEVTGNKTITGGIITGGTGNFDSGMYLGGGIDVIEGTFNMYGGSIVGNMADGGGVDVYQGNFNMYNGSIVGNTADNVGGGVDLIRGIFNMYGGSITNNTAIDGGGVYVDDGYFTIIGGSITDNTAENNGGGVCVFSEHVTVGGSAVISGNTKGSSANNVYLAVDGGVSSKLSVGTGGSAPVTEVPDKMNIHVTTSKYDDSIKGFVSNSVGDIIVESGAISGQEDCFKCDDSSKIVKLDNGALVLAEKKSDDSEGGSVSPSIPKPTPTPAPAPAPLWRKN